MPPKMANPVMTICEKTVVFAGTMKIKRSVAVKLAQDAGARVVASISGKTDVLIAGNGAEGKAAEATSKGIAVLAEAAFLDLCNAPEGSSNELDREKTQRSPNADVDDSDERPQQVARQEQQQHPPVGEVIEIDLATSKAAISRVLTGKHAVHVRVTNKKDRTVVPNEFLMHQSCIQSIDLGLLQDLHSIGVRFLVGCDQLSSIDLTPLAGVREIGDQFLSGCRALKSVDLSALSSVENLGNYFLSNCTSLLAVDLRPCTALKQNEIGESFLCGCHSLQALDLTPFQGVAAVGKFFLVGCAKLDALDLTPLSSVEVIDDNFLSSSGVLSLDLAPLSNVVRIGRSFLGGCTSLKTIDLGPLSSVDMIGDYFLYCCRGLESVDLAPLAGVSKIGDFFLAFCTGLQTGPTDTTPLVRVPSVGFGFMQGSTIVHDVDLPVGAPGRN